VSSPDAVIDAISSGTVRAAAILKRQTPEKLASVKNYMRERILSYEQSGSYVIPAHARVVTAHKPQ